MTMVICRCEDIFNMISAFGIEVIGKKGKLGRVLNNDQNLVEGIDRCHI